MSRLDAGARILFRDRRRSDSGALSYKQMVGREIGNYRIVEIIGAGGMGVVYKAIDTNLDRVVAVKALSPEFSGNPALLDRFRGEARAQAQLNHPNLATLYAFLVQEDVAYMVMEYVDGETFHAMVAQRGPIPAAEAIPLFRQALAGIGHAHSQGIVHRDIKPSNIMLNRAGVVKVMDFGLAKVSGGHGVTRTGVRLGTAYYMSPEQVLVKPVDARSDIYSLGATLYEILAGQAPFHADSEFEILNDHVNTPPPRPTRLYPQIPSGIENAVLKALAKNPDHRFQTAEQFSAALERPEEFYSAKTMADAVPGAQDRPVSVTPVATAPPARAEFWTRPRKLAAYVGGALACLIALWLLFRPEPPPIIVEAPPKALAVAPMAPPAQPAATKETPAPANTAPLTTKPAPPVGKIVVPAATPVSITTVDPIDSKAGRVGQEFQAKLSAGVKVGDREAFHAGDAAQLRLGQTASDGRSGKAELILELVSITTGGQTCAVNSAPFLIKSGFLRKKKVAPGTQIEFTLTAPVTLTTAPS
ncbi:MAG: protein kinase [Bryobacteraceae bacterium]